MGNPATTNLTFERNRIGKNRGKSKKKKLEENKSKDQEFSDTRINKYQTRINLNINPAQNVRSVKMLPWTLLPQGLLRGNASSRWWPLGWASRWTASRRWVRWWTSWRWSSRRWTSWRWTSWRTSLTARTKREKRVREWSRSEVLQHFVRKTLFFFVHGK